MQPIYKYPEYWDEEQYINTFKDNVTYYELTRYDNREYIYTGSPYISATALASALGMGEVQVRKDLAAVTSGGKPKVGYVVSELIEELEQFRGMKAECDMIKAEIESLYNLASIVID